MQDVTFALLNLLWVLLIVSVLMVVSRRRAKAMKLAAENAGLSDIRSSFLGRVTGSWNGYTVRWNLFGGGKSGPERALVEIAAAAPGRLTIRKRFRIDLGISLFGPPVVQTMLDADYVVRSDEVMLTQRLVGDAKIVEAIRSGIVERFDSLELKTSIVRTVRKVKPIGRDQALRSAFQLASTVVERLGFPQGS